MALPEDFQRKLKELQGLYLKDLPGKLNELENSFLAAVTDPDHYPVLQRQAHSLAGSGATFGVAAVSAISRKIERTVVARRDAGEPLNVDDQRDILQWIADMRLVAEDAERPTPEPTATPPAPLARRGITLITADKLMADDLARQLGYFGYAIHHLISPDGLSPAALPQGTVAIICSVEFPDAPNGGPNHFSHWTHAEQEVTPLLFISQRDDMDARLSAVRAGGRAYINLPVDVSLLVTALERAVGSRKQAVRVLVVDDSPSFARFYADLLQEHGMRASTLTDPLGIHEAISEFQPDLILLDMYMPQCTGIELTQVIRQQDAFVGIPIVYLSAEDDVHKQLDAMGAGADDFLRKPIEPKQLVKSIQMRTQRHNQLRSFISRDGLTNLLNHSNLREALDVELSRAARGGQSMCFAMLDIDHFKSVNDRFGHPVGDQVLRTLARMLSERLRKTDIPGRYGGEEFGVVLSDTNGADAVRVIDQLREDFSQIRHRAGDTEFRVTFSAGIAEFPGIKAIDALTRAADVALYEAKRRGRNRVELSLRPR